MKWRLHKEALVASGQQDNNRHIVAVPYLSSGGANRSCRKVDLYRSSLAPASYKSD